MDDRSITVFEPYFVVSNNTIRSQHLKIGFSLTIIRIKIEQWFANKIFRFILPFRKIFDRRADSEDNTVRVHFIKRLLYVLKKIPES